MTSPTALTLAHLRTLGAMAEVVEQTIHAKGKGKAFVFKRDLWGFLDILAVYPNMKGVHGIQATTTENVSKRTAKITTGEVAERARLWLEAGNRISVYGWAKRGPRGARKLWALNETEIYLNEVGELETA